MLSHKGTEINVRNIFNKNLDRDKQRNAIITKKSKYKKEHNVLAVF